MRRLVGVVLEQRGPLGVEVLGDPPVVRRSEVVDHARGDPQRTLAQGGVIEHVGGRQQRLDGVHVGVDAAVGIERRPRLVPLLDDHPERLVPEVVEQHGEGLGEQPVRPGTLGRGGAGRGEYDERVLVGGLVGGGRPVLRQPRPPAAVDAVPEQTAQRGHAVVGELGAVGPTHQVAEGVDVGHPAGDPELPRPVEVDRAVVLEPAEPAAGVARGTPEVEQPVTLLRQPAQVCRVAELEHQRLPYVSPTLYVATPSVESLCP